MHLIAHALDAPRVNVTLPESPSAGPFTPHRPWASDGASPNLPRASGGTRARPAYACAEMLCDAPESAMFSIEAAHVRGAADARRREFATVRHCARAALRRIGVPAVPILPGPDRAPRWPAGVVGSMTHCHGYRAAAVGRSDVLRSIGIDAEPHAALPQDALELVLRDDEQARLLALAAVDPDVHWDRVLFCAKEAVFKAWFPLTRRWLDFADVSTTLDRDGTFLARLHVPAPRVAGAVPRAFRGRWVVGRGLVVVATSALVRPEARAPRPSVARRTASGRDRRAAGHRPRAPRAAGGPSTPWQAT